MFRLARPTSRIIGCLLALLLLAQAGLMGAVRAAQPRWLEICSATGTSYVLAADPAPAVTGHDGGAHCPACPIGQSAALPATPSVPAFMDALAGIALPSPAPLARAVPEWRPSLPRGPPLLA